MRPTRERVGERAPECHREVVFFFCKNFRRIRCLLLFPSQLSGHLRETGHSLFHARPRDRERRTKRGTKRFECLAWLAVANQLTTPGPVKHYSYCSRDFSGRLGPPCIRRLQSTNEYRGESAARERAHSACNTRTHVCAHVHRNERLASRGSCSVHRVWVCVCVSECALRSHLGAQVTKCAHARFLKLGLSRRRRKVRERRREKKEKRRLWRGWIKREMKRRHSDVKSGFDGGERIGGDAGASAIRRARTLDRPRERALSIERTFRVSSSKSPMKRRDERSSRSKRRIEYKGERKKEK